MTSEQVSGEPSQLLILARDIKLSHSVFALPFALLAAFLAAGSVGRKFYDDPIALLLIVACMVCARTVAMAVNRLADTQIDKQNPRTITRAMPSGLLTKKYMLSMIFLFSAGFFISAGGFWYFSNNFWPLLLSPAVLGWLCLYSFTKRFTWLCHLFLGSALAISPLAAVIAIEPSYLTHSTPYLLAAMVMFWVAGFDVIYALQDIEADQSLGLYSMPKCLGVQQSLWISRVLHLLVMVMLVLMGQQSAQLTFFFNVGIGGVMGLLILEHTLVWGSKTHRINLAFLTVNGIISLLLGGLGIVDILHKLG